MFTGKYYGLGNRLYWEITIWRLRHYLLFAFHYRLIFHKMVLKSYTNSDFKDSIILKSQTFPLM